MHIGSTLQCFADVVTELEGEGHDVSALSSRTEEDGLRGELSVEIGFLPDSLDVDGVSVTVTDVRVDDGAAVADLSVRLSEGAVVRATPSSGDPERPAYKDPERLRQVYEAHDTFPEMTEALGVDVTPKTVRNYMVEHGIHDPEINKRNGESASSDADEAATAAAGAAEEDGVEGTEAADACARTGAPDAGGTPADGNGSSGGLADAEPVGEEVVRSDGLGFPAGVTMQDLKRSVRSASTLYDVRRELGVDHEQARTLLKELNLLDLVYGRLVDEPGGEVSMDEIDERIRSAVGAEVS